MYQCTLVDAMSVHNNVRRGGGVGRWIFLAALPVVAIAALSSVSTLGFEELGSGTLEMLILTMGRWVALGLATWLLVTHLLYTTAVVTQTDWMVTLLRPITLPIIRRVAAGMTAMTISLSSLAAVAETGHTATAVTGQSDPQLRQEATPTPILQPLVEPEDITEPPIETEVAIEPEGSYSAPLTWLVRPGDHLWSIAGEHLTIVLEREPTADEHRRYWVEVVKAACPVIRSGDPNLIYPDEEIPLPPTLDAGITR